MITGLESNLVRMRSLYFRQAKKKKCLLLKVNTFGNAISQTVLLIDEPLAPEIWFSIKKLTDYRAL